MMKIILFFISFCLNSQIVDDVVISTNTFEKKLYKPVNLRNPMVRTSVFNPTTLNYEFYKSSSPYGEALFNIDNIVLEGIMSNKNFKEALLRDRSSGAIYIVRNGRIYTLGRKQIEGYTAEILGKSVVLYDKRKEKKIELIIQNEGDGI